MKKEKNFEDIELVSMHDIARLLKVSYSQVKLIRYQTDFPDPVRIGRQWRWKLSDIKNWIDKQKKPL